MKAKKRRGLSLVELLISMSIMSLMAASLTALAVAVHQANAHGQGHAVAVQHASVLIDRIERTMRYATANDQFPGFISVSAINNTLEFPDTLVVWNPSGPAVDPDGLPRFNELVIFAPDPVLPYRLLEFRVPADARPVPPVDNLAAWGAELDAIKTSPATERIQLTDLMRISNTDLISPDAASDPLSGKALTAVVPSQAKFRGNVRFQVDMRPTQKEIDDYRASALAWDAIAWPLGLSSRAAGLRQVWCRFEVQVMPGEDALRKDRAGQSAIPFLGSAAVQYAVTK